MQIYRYALAVALSLMLAACATTARHVEKDIEKTPEPAAGEVAVMGDINLIEFVIKVPLPAKEQDGSIYLGTEDSDKKYKVECSDAGEFGVYLPSGTYKVYKITVGGYTFVPDSLTLKVPKDKRASYAGTLVLDGSPTGVDQATDDTIFVYTVKDEYDEFFSAAKGAGAGVDEKVEKSLFRAGNSRAVGSYPSKVMRPKDVSDNLEARSRDVEDVVQGVVETLPYLINPSWILTLP